MKLKKKIYQFKKLANVKRVTIKRRNHKKKVLKTIPNKININQMNTNQI